MTQVSYASEPCKSQMVCLQCNKLSCVKITSIFTQTNSIKRLHCSLSLLSGICPFSQDGVIRSSSKSAGCVGRRQEAQGAHKPDTLLSCSFWDSETVHGIRGMWDGPLSRRTISWMSTKHMQCTHNVRPIYRNSSSPNSPFYFLGLPSRSVVLSCVSAASPCKHPLRTAAATPPQRRPPSRRRSPNEFPAAAAESVLGQTNRNAS